MSDFSNYLDDHEIERLAILAEEAGEFIQAIGKILRHGYDSFHPDKPLDGDNRDHLCQELGDLRYIVNFMEHRGDFDGTTVDAYCSVAADKKPKYMHHQDCFNDHPSRNRRR